MCSFQPVPITTQRLSLREAAPRDAQAIAAWSAEAGALLPANPFDEDRKAFVIERHEGEIVGVIGFKPRGRFSELDCWIAPVHRGQGYATEAVPAALAWAAGSMRATRPRPTRLSAPSWAEYRKTECLI